MGTSEFDEVSQHKKLYLTNDSNKFGLIDLEKTCHWRDSLCWLSTEIEDTVSLRRPNR